MNAVVSITFDYNILAPEQVTFVQMKANLVRQQLCKTVAAIV